MGGALMKRESTFGLGSFRNQQFRCELPFDVTTRLPLSVHIVAVASSQACSQTSEAARLASLLSGQARPQKLLFISETSSVQQHL